MTHNERKYQSRKWRLAIAIVVLATLGAFVPPIVSTWLFGAVEPLVVLSGAEWVSVITLVTGLYIGGNVYQKHIENKSVSIGVSASVSTEAKTNTSSGVKSGSKKEKEA